MGVLYGLEQEIHHVLDPPESVWRLVLEQQRLVFVVRQFLVVFEQLVQQQQLLE